MNDFLMQDEQDPMERFLGVVVGVVTDNKDPKNLGRVKLKFPWWADKGESNWAPIASFMSGKNFGGYFLPDKGDNVLVAFMNGNIKNPFVLGAIWNTKFKTPEKNSDGKNNVRLIKSRSGHQLIFDDKKGSEKIEIIDKTNKNKITIDSKSNKITISSSKDLELVAKGKVSISGSNIEMKATKGSATLQSKTAMTVKSSGAMTVKGKVVKIN